MWTAGRQKVSSLEDLETFGKRKSRNGECVCKLVGKDVWLSSIPLFPFLRDESIDQKRTPFGKQEFGYTELE